MGAPKVPESQKPETGQETQHDKYLQILEGLYGKEVADQVLNLKDIDEAGWEKCKGAYEMMLGSGNFFSAFPGQKVSDFNQKVAAYLDGPKKDSVLGKHLAELMGRLIAEEGERTKKRLHTGIESSISGGLSELKAHLGPVPKMAPAKTPDVQKVTTPTESEYTPYEHTPEQLRQFATEVMKKPNWRQYILDTILSHDDEDARSKIFEINQKWEQLNLPPQFAQWQVFFDKFIALTKSACLKFKKYGKENKKKGKTIDEAFKLVGIEQDIAQFSAEFAGVKPDFSKDEWAALMFIDYGVESLAVDAFKEAQDFYANKQAQAEYAAEIVKNSNWKTDLVSSLSDPFKVPKIAVLAFSENKAIPSELKDFLNKLVDFEARAKQKFESILQNPSAENIDQVLQDLAAKFKEEFPEIKLDQKSAKDTMQLLAWGTLSRGKELLEPTGLTDSVAVQTPAPVASQAAKSVEAAKPGDPVKTGEVAKTDDFKKPESPKSKTQGAAAQKDSSKPDTKMPDITLLARRAANMSFSDLIVNLIKSGVAIAETFGGFFKGGPTELIRKAGNGFKAEEKEKISLDLKKAEKEKFKGPEESVKYVAGVLNLPLRENAAAFLKAFATSGYKIESIKSNMFDKDQKIGLQVGDLLFFQRPKSNPTANPGNPTTSQPENEVYMTAIVSSVDSSKSPPVIEIKSTFMNNSEPVTKQIDLNDPLFKDNFKGYIKIPQTRPQEAAAATGQAPGATEAPAGAPQTADKPSPQAQATVTPQAPAPAP